MVLAWNCFFRHSSNPHVLYKVLNGQDILYVNYDIVDKNGYYDFSFVSSGHDFTQYDEVLVLVNRDNSAVTMAGGNILSFYGSFYGSYFGFEQAAIIPFNGTSLNSVSPIELVDQEGAILRNGFVSKEYLTRFYGNSINVPSVTVWIKPISGDGLFRYEKSCSAWLFNCREDHWIEIRNTVKNLRTISHEYGHYVNYQLFGSTANAMSSTSAQIKEGFAIFFSFAVRNYANKVYGDELPDTNYIVDNPEIGPYETDRYDNILYTKTGHPEYGAFASFLWNLYDQYDGGIYEAELYAGDNDDVSYQPTRVFDIMKSMCGKSPAQFLSMYKSGIPYQLRESVQDIYDFTLVNKSQPMRPAQLENVSFNKIGSNKVKFNFIRQSYGDERFYSNTESGVKIYRKSSGNWVYIASVPAHLDSYTYTRTAGVNLDYKFTTYNSSGHAYGPKYINLGMDLSISGPSMITDNQAGNWTVNVSGGEGNYHYRWWRNYKNDLESLIGTSKTLNYAFPPDWDQMTLRAEVLSGGESVSMTRVVNCSDCPLNCEEQLYNNIVMSPNPSSDNFSISLPEFDDCGLTTLSDGNFELSFVDESTGKLMDSERFKSNKYTSKAFRKLVRGKYIARFRYANGMVEKHVVKQ